MESVLNSAIQTVKESELSFSKFIKPNDTGKTGGHQAGFHISKNAWKLFFDAPGIKGENKDKFVIIKWQDDFETESRFIYYGRGTRNEYRLTRFGNGFPFLSDDNVGDLLIISKLSNDYYKAFVLQSDEDIESFFAAYNISSNDTNGIIQKSFIDNPESNLQQCFHTYLQLLKMDFPPTSELAQNARTCYNQAFSIKNSQIKLNPDSELLNWLNAEFQLFKLIENSRYSTIISKPFATVEELIINANTILNRRKSRAGKSLEHHLNEVFNIFELLFQAQVTTLEKHKPDFLFPGLDEYLNPHFNSEKLIVLAAKTTCKDRWRQILNEADRIKTKHLFTLQQSISKNQLNEMYKHNVCLVVPKAYIRGFPEEYRDKIYSLEGFVKFVMTKQS
jgi:hypothetical protein